MLNIVSSSRYKINRILIKKTVFDMLTNYSLPATAVLNIVFVGKKKMNAISKKYKQENLALPVLSFSYLTESINRENLIGEIFICYPQAVLLAAEREKKVDNIILQLINHGLNNILK